MPIHNSQHSTIASTIICACLLCLTLFAGQNPARAEQVLEEVAFDGQLLTIVETDDQMQSIRLGQRELGKNHFAGFERVAEINGLPVALFYLGDGGNACSPGILIVWRNEKGEIEKQDHNGACNMPLPSITANGIFFIPQLRPGESASVTQWTPSDGITTIADMQYQPQPDTNWNDLDNTSIYHPIDLFRNEAIYNTAQKLIGEEELLSFTDGLSVASEPKQTEGFLVAAGCKPHNCGEADSLIIVDKQGQALYLAQQINGTIRQWPQADQWTLQANNLLEGFKASR